MDTLTKRNAAHPGTVAWENLPVATVQVAFGVWSMTAIAFGGVGGPAGKKITSSRSD